MDNYKNDGRRIAELVTVIIFSLDEKIGRASCRERV